MKGNIKYTKCFLLKIMEEEEVALAIGYKTTEKGRKAGYKQIKNLKKQFKEKRNQINRELRYYLILNELNKEQQQWLRENYNTTPSLIELTRQLFMDETLDGRTKEGRAVRRVSGASGYEI